MVLSRPAKEENSLQNSRASQTNTSLTCVLGLFFITSATRDGQCHTTRCLTGIETVVWRLWMASSLRGLGRFAHWLASMKTERFAIVHGVA